MRCQHLVICDRPMLMQQNVSLRPPMEHPCRQALPQERAWGEPTYKAGGQRMCWQGAWPSDEGPSGTP